MAPSLDDLRRRFEQFAKICEGRSPLYAVLAQGVATAPEILELAARAHAGQPPANLLFGAVHDLLLSGIDDPLGEFYPSIGGSRECAEAWPSFADFCRRHRREIAEVVATRRVQTNEVGRCGILMPVFALVARLAERPLHLIEVGSSAGLSLLFDRYRYEYAVGETSYACGPDSSVVIRTRVLGDVGALTIPVALPRVSARIGIDIEPVDVTDARAMRWIEALIWPDDPDRLARHRLASAIAAHDPPRVIAGDGLELAPSFAAGAPADVLPCVFHSHAIFQMTAAWRAAFEERLDLVGQHRDLAHVSFEWLDEEGDASPHRGEGASQLRIALWREGRRTAAHLAECDPHGRWLRPAPERAAHGTPKWA